MKIKICGMRDAENIRAVIDLDPSFMGFIFYENSPRYVGTELELPADFPELLFKVGVFVNAPLAEMMEIVTRYDLDYVQLHGNESPAICQALIKERVGVIKVFSVGPDFDFAKTAPFDAVSDFYLFDTQGAQPGGNGTAFDWNLLRKYRGQVPFFISGGLSAANIRQAMNVNHKKLYGFDLNSGVESAPGMKDVNLIKQVYDKMAQKA